MRIYLVRHGESEANRSRFIQGTLDSPLTEQGRLQAQKLRQILPKEFDRIYLSPLSRAKETGLIALDLSERDPLIQYDDRLMEISFGDLQGTPYSDFPTEPEEVRQHIRFERDILKGKFQAERIEHFLQRTAAVFDEIVNEMRAENLKQVIIFSHGGFLRSIVQHHLLLDDHRWENCEYGVLEYGNEWQLTRYRDHIISGN